MTENKRRNARERASDRSLIARMKENGTGSWLLGLYRSGVLVGLVFATIFYTDAKSMMVEFQELRISEQLTTIKVQLTDVLRRLDGIEGREFEGPTR